MKVYIIAKKQAVTHGHGSCGEDLAMPIFDSYSNTYTNIPVFSSYGKAVMYLELIDKFGFYTIVPTEFK